MPILVTGGAGYIGSHTVVELLQAGHDVTIVDSLQNADPAVLPRIAELGGRAPEFLRLDIRDERGLDAAFAAGMGGSPFEAVVHFAGLKAVGESVRNPIGYWDTNVNGTLVLLRTMQRNSVHRIVFSSSATVYDAGNPSPLDEDSPTGPINPYGETKLAIERILAALCASDPCWRVSVLRYFNPVGAHPSGRIGEDPRDTPNNLMPYITQVAVGRREQLQIFGDDYPTPDGTGVRDYIHVVDLARGHLAALRYLETHAGHHVHNLGTGRGSSVLELLEAFETASGCAIPRKVVTRRPGDAAAVWARTERARDDLGWTAEFDLATMCRDAWNWQRLNPQGYRYEDPEPQRS
jgi:UDP-glucose 4-epimerase